MQANSSPFTITVAATGAAKRWNPGHYIRAQGDVADPDQAAFMAEQHSDIDRFVTDLDGQAVELKGAYVKVSWGNMNPTGSTFDFTDTDGLINNLASKNKKAIIELSYKSFRAGSSLGVLVPQDLEYQADPTSRGWWGGLHRPATMTRFVEACQAFADRYDSNPAVECLVTPETSPSWSGSAPADYNRDDYAAQLIRLYRSVGPMFAKVNYCPGIGSLSGWTETLMEECWQQRIGINAPDARSNVVAWGLYEGGGAAVRDYRFEIPHPASASSSTMKDQGPATAIIDRMQQQECTHFCWITGETAPGITWTEVKAAILADPAMNLACPNRYAACEP